MQIFESFEYKPDLSLALGFFDGVHLAHRCVINNAVQCANQNNIPSAVLTFKNSPAQFFTNNKIWNILPIEKKIEHIKALNVDYLFLLEFEKFVNLTALNYLQNYLIKYLRPKFITTGFNHTLGRDKQVAATFLKNNQQQFVYNYFEIPPITYENILISSSVIKTFVEKADFYQVKKLLGYDFYLTGTVIEGNKLGRTISFPTVNLLYPDNIVEIPNGVYFAKVKVDGKLYNAILNYGQKPTVATSQKAILEAHILDFNENIYNQEISIIPLKKIREEQKFLNIEELKKQLKNDCDAAKNFFIKEEFKK